MKLKINKLMPYSEQNKKYKTLPVNVNNRNYYLSPHPLDKQNFAGIIVPLHFVCTLPDMMNSDYEYLHCHVRVEHQETRETVAKSQTSFKDLKRQDGKRQFLFEFVPPYRGVYGIFIEMLYKQKFFIQTSQPPQEMRETSTVQLQCEDPFGVEENIVYEEKPFSITFPLYVQYTITNRLKDDILEIQMKFKSESFDYVFENEQTKVRLSGGQTFYAVLKVTPKADTNKMDLLFGGGNLLLGTFWLLQNKNKFEKKLLIRQGFKHLLFRAETIDKKVVKQDIVEVRVKFINLYEMDYQIGPIKLSINQQDIPAGIKLLKTSKDTMELSDKSEELVTLTMICLRSGFFQFKGITLNIKDKHNPKEERILKYINEITFVVENEQAEKGVDVMERTSKVEIDELL